MLIRPAVSDDAVPIAAIHVAGWRDAYATILDPDFLAGPIESDRRTLWAGRCASALACQKILVAEVDGEIIGFVCAIDDQDPTRGVLIDNLHVMPERRGGRIGEQLLRRAAAWAEAVSPGCGMYLWVFAENQAARRFYGRLGAHEAEQTVSDIPSARGKTVLRLRWPSAADLARET